MILLANLGCYHNRFPLGQEIDRLPMGLSANSQPFPPPPSSDLVRKFPSLISTPSSILGGQQNQPELRVGVLLSLRCRLFSSLIQSYFQGEWIEIRVPTNLQQYGIFLKVIGSRVFISDVVAKSQAHRYSLIQQHTTNRHEILSFEGTTVPLSCNSCFWPIYLKYCQSPSG